MRDPGAARGSSPGSPQAEETSAAKIKLMNQEKAAGSGQGRGRGRFLRASTRCPGEGVTRLFGADTWAFVGVPARVTQQ